MNRGTKIKYWMDQTIDTILPPRCVVSGEIVSSQGMLSGKAWADLDFIASPFCKCCGIPFDFDDTQLGFDETHCAGCLENRPVFKSARSVVSYNDASRKMILSFKHGDQTHLVRAFVPWLERAGAELLDQTDIVVPVPLHPFRLIRRRYNQSALISHFLAKETGLVHIPDALIRSRSTLSQGHLAPKDRAKNVRRAFIVNEKHKKRLAGKNILLIDDVYTTGATVHECTKTLLKQGVGSVNVLTLSRVLKK